MVLSWISSVPLSNFQIFLCTTCSLTINDLFSWYYIMLQLQDLKVSAYNGPGISDTPLAKTPLPEQASQLSQPFIIHYYEGQVVSMSIQAGEEQWAINMKRGLASLLQVDLSHMHTPAFVSTEVHCSVKCNSRDVNVVIVLCHLLALNSAWLWVGYLRPHSPPSPQRDYSVLHCVETRFWAHQVS